MDAELIEAYRQRWRAVAEVEREEARKATCELRWRQLNALVGLAKELNISFAQDESEEEAGRVNWHRLQQIYEQRI